MRVSSSYTEIPESTKPFVVVDSRSIESSIQGFKAQMAFPLQRLPMELQLRILEHILVSPIPIINLYLPPRDHAFQLLFEGEKQGQDLISPSMIFTSKLFYKEGLRLLYSYNTFVYSDLPGACTFSMSRYDLENFRESGPTPTTKHPSISSSNEDTAFTDHAANISVRISRTHDSWFLRVCADSLFLVKRFTNLKTFRLDFIDVTTGYDDYWDEDEFMLHRLQLRISNTIEALQHPPRPVHALSEITLTGLARNDLTLYVVKQYARLLAPTGRIAVGWGAKGKRFELHECKEVREVTREEDLELVWMKADEVGAWIGREHQSTGSKWLFDEEPNPRDSPHVTE